MVNMVADALTISLCSKEISQVNTSDQASYLQIEEKSPALALHNHAATLIFILSWGMFSKSFFMFALLKDILNSDVRW